MLPTRMRPCRGLSREPSLHPKRPYVTWIMKEIADFFTIF